MKKINKLIFIALAVLTASFAFGQTKIPLKDLSSNGAVLNQVMKFNGTVWGPGSVSGGMLFGSGVPSNGAGGEGDSYCDTATGNLYIKSSGSWVLQITFVSTVGSYSDPSWLTLSKSKVGLSNVDNTSDASKPVSTAAQTALDNKADQSDLTSGLAAKQDLVNSVAPAFDATPLAALIIDPSKALSTKSVSANSVFTFLTDPNDPDTTFGLRLTNTDSTSHQHTIPETFDMVQQQPRTTFWQGPGEVSEIFITWDGTQYTSWSLPQPAPGSEYTVASVTNPEIVDVPSTNIYVTGTTTITGFGVAPVGETRKLRFAGALSLTHNATSLEIMPGRASYTTAANDVAWLESKGSGNWRVLSITKANGEAVVGGGGGSGEAAGSIKLWNTTDIANRPATWLLADGTYGTLNMTATQGATYIVKGNNETVADPTFDPVAGSYGSTQNVTIATATPGATVVYTLDDSPPTRVNGTVYSTPVALAATDTLKAFAYLDLSIDSGVVTGTYTIGSGYNIEDNLEHVDNAAAATAGWVNSGTPTWGYATAPAPHQGSYSLQLNASSDSVILSLPSAKSDQWFYFTFQTSSAASASMRVSLLDATDTAIATAYALSTGAWRANAGGGGNADSSTGLVNTSKYQIKLHYVTGTGANAVLAIYESQDATNWTLVANRTAGTSTTDVAKLKLNIGASVTAVFDRVIDSDTDISINP